MLLLRLTRFTAVEDNCIQALKSLVNKSVKFTADAPENSLKALIITRLGECFKLVL
ncbi:hypothetical protein JCM16161A_07540 [Vulcanisaeta sp. JCM 16161]|uniref:hypothetical protein n=1 Tax=Vulcanisaeta sp. JCM 16161 TaxID=1295372 RepID=UPI000A789473